MTVLRSIKELTKIALSKPQKVARLEELFECYHKPVNAASIIISEINSEVEVPPVRHSMKLTNFYSCEGLQILCRKVINTNYTIF